MIAFLSSTSLPYRSSQPSHHHFSSSNKCLNSNPLTNVGPIHLKKRPKPQYVMSNIRTFDASDFEIRRLLGQQSFATITDWTYYVPTPFAETRTTQPSAPAIRLYDARVVAPIPQMYNARVLLKEFLPPAIELGVSEAEAYNLIYSSSISSQVKSSDQLPVATLIGSFLTDDSFNSPQFIESWRSRFPRSPQPPSKEAPFLVFRYEGMKTALAIATQSANDDNNNNNTSDTNNNPAAWFDSFFPSNLYARKKTYMRAFMIKCLTGLKFLHSQVGLVHRSIGLASIMVNTTEWRYASNLDIKFRDFGFARTTSALAQGKDLDRARRAEAFTPTQITAFYFAEDIYALGYAFTELIFSVFSKTIITQDSFKKLFEDTFDFDLDASRDYCKQDPNWEDAVKFLDECDQSGWDMIFTMLRARKDYATVSIETVSESPFLQAKF